MPTLRIGKFGGGTRVFANAGRYKERQRAERRRRNKRRAEPRWFTPADWRTLIHRRLTGFARSGFNVEGIICLPIGDRTCSVVLLVVNEDERLEQLIRQLRKLEDGLAIHGAPEARAAFAAVAGWLG